MGGKAPETILTGTRFYTDSMYAFNLPQARNSMLYIWLDIALNISMMIFVRDSVLMLL